jgi:hypothetical protein
VIVFASVSLILAEVLTGKLYVWVPILVFVAKNVAGAFSYHVRKLKDGPNKYYHVYNKPMILSPCREIRNNGVL